MAVVYPEIFETAQVCVDVELEGELTRGATVGDWKNHWGREAQTTVLTKVDQERFFEKYLNAIKRIPYKFSSAL